MVSATFQSSPLLHSLLTIFAWMIVPGTLRADAAASIDTPVAEASVAVDSLTIADGATVQLEFGASRVMGEGYTLVHLSGGYLAMQGDQTNGDGFSNLGGGRWVIASDFGLSDSPRQEERFLDSTETKVSTDTPQINLNREMFESVQDPVNWAF
jgi:hypothetical protein